MQAQPYELEYPKAVNAITKLGVAFAFVAVWLGLGYALYHGYHRFEQGGWGMWPILGVGLIFVIITGERSYYLFYKARSHKKQFLAGVQRHLLEGDVAGAIQYCRAEKMPVAQIVGSGLSHLHRPDQEVQDAVDDAALMVLPQIETRTGYLAMIGNIATLLGLLGTIVGLIISFAGVSLEDSSAGMTKQKWNDTVRRAGNYVYLVPSCKGLQDKDLVHCIGNNKSTILAKGISEAMNCTAFGLLVGILALLGFSALNGRTQAMLDDISDSTVQLMNLAVMHRSSMKIGGVDASTS